MYCIFEISQDVRDVERKRSKFYLNFELFVVVVTKNYVNIIYFKNVYKDHSPKHSLILLSFSWCFMF